MSSAATASSRPIGHLMPPTALAGLDASDAERVCAAILASVPAAVVAEVVNAVLAGLEQQANAARARLH